MAFSRLRSRCIWLAARSSWHTQAHQAPVPAAAATLARGWPIASGSRLSAKLLHTPAPADGNVTLQYFVTEATQLVTELVEEADLERRRRCAVLFRNLVADGQKIVANCLNTEAIKQKLSDKEVQLERAKADHERVLCELRVLEMRVTLKDLIVELIDTKCRE